MKRQVNYTNKETCNKKKIKISDIYHYYQFITSVLLEQKCNYPNPIYGEPLSIKEVVSAWEKTVKLIDSGEAPNKFNLYIHIPFCTCKCLFCFSNSFRTKRVQSVLKKHLKMLYDEMGVFSPVLKNIPISAIYIGGGTPSLLEKEDIVYLFVNMRKHFSISSDTRIIFEASPFTLNFQKIDALKELGITELALGVQTFNDDVLKKNRRPQTSDHTIKIYKYARKIHIPSITFDIMIGLPYQSEDSSIASTEQAINLRPDGILLNEFLPVVQTDFFLENNRYTPEEIASRNKTTKLAERILKKAGYFSTCQGYRRKWTKYDEEHIYETQETENLLGLGYGANSHAYSTLRYVQLFSISKYFASFENCSFYPDSARNLRKMIDDNLAFPSSSDKNKNGQKFAYFGFPTNKKREMHTYAYSKISNLSLKGFHDRFNMKFEEVFKEQLFILKKLCMINIDNNKITIDRKYFHHYPVIRTLFIDKDYIQKMLINSNEKYDPSKDYSEVLKKLNRLVGET